MLHPNIFSSPREANRSNVGTRNGSTQSLTFVVSLFLIALIQTPEVPHNPKPLRAFKH
jgi:hypothetical protein